MGQVRVKGILALLGVLIVGMSPGSWAAIDPQSDTPDSIPQLGSAIQEGQRQLTSAREQAESAPGTVINLVDGPVDQAQDTAETTSGGAGKEANKARDQAADAKHGVVEVVVAQLSTSSGSGQQLLNEVTVYAQNAFNAIRIIAEDLLVRLSTNDANAGQEFRSKSVARGDVSVSSEATTTAPGLAEAGLAMAVAAAGAGGALLWYVGLQRFFALAFFPLLSRIAHSEIYNNDARRRIGELVTGEPGLCLNDLVDRTGYSRNAVSYHLFVLEKEEELVSIKDGKYRRYFARNGKYVNGAKNVVSALRNPTTLRMAQHVVEHPGTIQRELCHLLGTTASAACWHAKRLEELRVIRKERVANTVQYYPGEAMSKYDLSEFGIRRAAATAASGPAAPAGLPTPLPLQ